MVNTLNTFVDLLGDFPIPTSIEDCPGKELAKLLANGLEQQGIEILGIEGLDYYHEIRCIVEGNEYQIIVSVDDLAQPRRWTVHSFYQLNKRERRRKQSYRIDFEKLLILIDKTLREIPSVHDLRWFPEFDAPWILDNQAPADSPTSNPCSSQEPTKLNRVFGRIVRCVLILLTILLIIAAFCMPERIGRFVGYFWIIALIMAIVIANINSHFALSKWEQRKK